VGGGGGIGFFRGEGVCRGFWMGELVVGSESLVISSLMSLAVTFFGVFQDKGRSRVRF
jgi:hypothetical protein